MVNTVNVVAFLFKTKKQEKTTKTRLNTSLLRSQDLNYNIQQSVLAVHRPFYISICNFEMDRGCYPLPK